MHYLQLHNAWMLLNKKEWNNAICSKWVDLEIITLSEVSQTKKEIPYHLYMDSKNSYRWTCLQNRNKLTDIENKHMITKGDSRD